MSYLSKCTEYSDMYTILLSCIDTYCEHTGLAIDFDQNMNKKMNLCAEFIIRAGSDYDYEERNKVIFLMTIRELQSYVDSKLVALGGIKIPSPKKCTTGLFF